MTTPTDADLIAASLDDPGAFAALYERHAGDIHRYAARRLGLTTADDITSATFVIALRGLARYDRRRPSARPWLYGIAANLIDKHWRQEERALRALARTGHDPVAESWEQGAADRMSAQAVNRELAMALVRLTNRDRQVLLLIAWADLTYEEVADALAIPVGTVRSRLNRARRHVREALAGEPTLDVAQGARHG